MAAKQGSKGYFIYTRKDSSGFILRFKDEATGAWREHRIPREFTNKREAERYSVAWLGALKEQGAAPQTPVAPKPDKGPTLRELSEEWIKLRKKDPKLRPATVSADKSNLEIHILPRIGDVPIRELGSGALKRFIRDLRESPPTSKAKGKKPTKEGRTLAPYTVRNVCNTLTTMLEDIIGEEWIDLIANPMKNNRVRKEIPDGSSRAGRNVIIHLSRDQAERVITCADVPEARRVRYLLAVTSGMRDGEISGLCWEDVDLDAKIPTVNVTKSCAIKGPKGWASVGETKTEDGVRLLPLHHLAVKALRTWKSGGFVQSVGRASKPSDPVFPDEKCKHYRPKSGELLRRDLRRAGCSDTYGTHNIDFHATRRSFATWLDANGVPEKTVKRLMGHAGAGVTQRNYTARVLEPLQAAVETIELNLSCGQVIALPLKVG